jgi:hypothetical protein
MRIFFSNFTITATNGDFRKGSQVSYKLNEPIDVFIENGGFVLAAPVQTLLKLFELIVVDPTLAAPILPRLQAVSNDYIIR